MKFIVLLFLLIHVCYQYPLRRIEMLQLQSPVNLDPAITSNVYQIGKPVTEDEVKNDPEMYVSNRKSFDDMLFYFCVCLLRICVYTYLPSRQKLVKVDKEECYFSKERTTSLETQPRPSTSKVSTTCSDELKR